MENILSVLRHRLHDWLVHLFAIARRDGSGWSVLFAIFISAASCLLVYFAVRRLKRAQVLLQLETGLAAEATHGSNQWAAAAKFCADRGEFRRAIHCAYWAAVLRLQESRCLSARAELTPREYLRLLTTENRFAGQRDALAGLTEQLERCFYGGNDAGPEDWSRSIASLEAIGCRIR